MVCVAICRLISVVSTLHAIRHHVLVVGVMIVVLQRRSVRKESVYPKVSAILNVRRISLVVMAHAVHKARDV